MKIYNNLDRSLHFTNKVDSKIEFLIVTTSSLLELAKSSTESTMGRSLGIVMQEMRIAVYRYTKTMQDKYQTAPIVRTELYELLVLFFAYMVTITNLSIRKNNKMKNENKSYNWRRWLQRQKPIAQLKGFLWIDFDEKARCVLSLRLVVRRLTWP